MSKTTRMRTAQLLLFCLLVCQNTESLTDKLVNLGENVTLDCQIDVRDIYWVFQKPSDSPLLILRTFSSDSTSSYVQDQRLKDKYSSLTLSRLFIINITFHELGIYYCAKAATTLQISNGTRLYINEEAARDHNQTELKNNSQCQTTQQSLIVLCFIPNIVMFLAIIGLFQIKLQACKKRHQQCQDEELEQLYSTHDEEFSEVEFRLFHPTNNTFLPFQKPKTKPRQTS
uniref:Immunoglobulin domain-containing protein n=1 Tax=Cyprinus carpio carpio TaxID=630221 RepID=A0A8C1A7P7_CYPCA